MNLKDQKNKLMQDAAALIRREKVTTEDRSNFDRMMADVDALEQDIAREERVATFEAEQRSNGRPPRSQPGAFVGSNDERKENERRAFSDYIRRGVVDSNYLASHETRDLGVGPVAGAITGGSQLVPQGFYPLLTEAQKSWGQLVGAVNQKQTDNGAPMKVALSDDTGNGLTVVGESTLVEEVDPNLKSALSSTDLVTTSLIKITLRELTDSSFDLDAFVRDSFGQRFHRGLSSFITSGNGSNVTSIVGTATLGATAQSAATIAYPDLIGVYSALDPAYIENASWVFSSSTRAGLMAQTDTLGRPLFIPSPNTGAFDTLLGRPIVINQSQDPVAASKFPVLFGDLKAGYTLRTVGDLSIVRLNEAYMPQLCVGFIGFATVGGFATDAGTHPILKLQMHAGS